MFIWLGYASSRKYWIQKKNEMQQWMVWFNWQSLWNTSEKQMCTWVAPHWSVMVMSTRIADEMKLFCWDLWFCRLLSCWSSSVLSALYWISMAAVVMGVIWSLATMVFLFKITLLCSLIPKLMVVINPQLYLLPLNKFHTEFKKQEMQNYPSPIWWDVWVVTLFCK